MSKRVIHSPKVYLSDTGLAAHLTRWSSPETLAHGALAGQIFETFVIGEIIKSYHFRGRGCPLWYYRDKEKREVDCILEQNGKLYPIEIKKAKLITQSDTTALRYFMKHNPTAEFGTVLCMVDQSYFIEEQILLASATVIS